MPESDLSHITGPHHHPHHPAPSVVTTRTSLEVDHVGVPVISRTGVEGDHGALVVLIVIKDNCTLFHFTDTNKLCHVLRKPSFCLCKEQWCRSAMHTYLHRLISPFVVGVDVLIEEYLLFLDPKFQNSSQPLKWSRLVYVLSLKTPRKQTTKLRLQIFKKLSI